MIDPHPIRERFMSLSPHLSERERRLFAATEARAAGYGGIAAVSAATGIAVSTIGRGLKELSAMDTLAPDRVRRPGGGRKLLVDKDATLLDDLLALVEPSERGDPMSPLRWTCKSLSQLAAALVAQGHRIGRTVVGELLHKQQVQPASQLQDPRRRQPSRPRRAVHSHQQKPQGGAGSAPAGNLGGHQEEGACGRLQKCRSGVASSLSPVAKGF